MDRGRWLIFFSLTPLLLAGTCRKAPPEPERETTEIQSPEVTLQVISVDPSTVTADRAFTVTLYGSALADGDEVYFGDRQASEVGYRNSNTLTVSGPPLPEGSYDVTVVRPSTRERAVLRSALDAVVRGDGGSGDDCRSATFYFDYDAYRLDSEAQRELSEVARCLSPKDWTVLLEGHCDERGSTEYNIALGQRRANAVKDALASQGVSPSRIRTVSYGEERPAVRGSGEAAWAKNRRVELKAQE